MTKVALKGPVNGTGTYTLRAPETANTLELELPLAGTHLAGAQADGMPLGPGGDPVVESGSNSDGWWTRWADGTQHCTRDRSVDTADVLWTFPVPFGAGPAPATFGSKDTIAYPGYVYFSNTSYTETTVRVSATGNSARLLVVGRWK